MPNLSAEGVLRWGTTRAAGLRDRRWIRTARSRCRTCMRGGTSRSALGGSRPRCGDSGGGAEDRPNRDAGLRSHSPSHGIDRYPARGHSRRPAQASRTGTGTIVDGSERATRGSRDDPSTTASTEATTAGIRGRSERAATTSTEAPPGRRSSSPLPVFLLARSIQRSGRTGGRGRRGRPGASWAAAVGLVWRSGAPNTRVRPGHLARPGGHFGSPAPGVSSGSRRTRRTSQR